MNRATKAPLTFLTAALCVIAACSGDDGSSDAGAAPTDSEVVLPTVTAMTLSPTSASVAVGRSTQLTATGTLEDGTTADVTARTFYTSNNLDAALVDGLGRVFGGAVGSATITATIDGLSATAVVTVTERGTPPTPDGLPMIVDDNFQGRAAFGDGGPPLHSEDDSCPTRGGGEAGVCHHFTWDGTGGGFTGAFWVNGDGFDSLNGVDVAAGATEVSFYAWGATAGQTIEFGAGLGGENRDLGEARASITLTTTPTMYTVPLSALGNYDLVYGGFIWVTNLETNPSGVEFYVDDIQWIQGDAPSGIALPMTVDDHYAGRSGFGPGGPSLHAEDELCPTRAGGESGVCHRIIWDGTGGGFTGAFWTDGDGFADLKGKEIEAGATEVRFYAWGATGGELIEFGAGLSPQDGGEARQLITLSTTPTEYTVSLAALGEYGPVFGPFIWAASVDNNPTGATFYMDDIQWVKGETQTEIPLPMVVDDHYQGRSGFGPDGPPLHTEDMMCPSRAGAEAGVCHRFLWDGTGGTFTGTFWTDGDGFMNLNGKAVAAGATEVRFYAWGATGGETIEFGAGLSPQDAGQARLIITLTTTPTEYVVPLAVLGNYGAVFGPFIWSASIDNNPSGATFYVDDIHWAAGAPPMSLPLPMTVDSNFTGRSGFGPSGPPLHTEDSSCPGRGGAMAGDCHRFVWDGSGGEFTGNFWTDGDGFVDLIGKPVQAGATEVRFYAWGATGGEVVEFGAGIGDANRDGAEARSEITLSTTPTAYSVPLTALAGYSLVYGPFMWAANTGNNPSGVTFYVDDIQWVDGN